MAIQVVAREMSNKSQSVRAELVEALWFRGVRFDRLNANGLIRYFLKAPFVFAQDRLRQVRVNGRT
jgi:hypothetical protein